MIRRFPSAVEFEDFLLGVVLQGFGVGVFHTTGLAPSSVAGLRLESLYHGLDHVPWHSLSQYLLVCFLFLYWVSLTRLFYYE